MKTFMSSMTVVLLTVGLWGSAGAQPADGTEKMVGNLRETMAKFEKIKLDLGTTRRDIDTKLLGTNERVQLMDRLQMDQEDLSYCRNEGLDEAGYLRGEWADLTDDERDLVTEAENELGG